MEKTKEHIYKEETAVIHKTKKLTIRKIFLKPCPLFTLKLQLHWCLVWSVLVEK